LHFRYAEVLLGISTIEDTTCSLFAVAAVTCIVSPDTSIKSLLNSSIVVLAATALILNKLNTTPPFVIVTVIVSALLVSFDMRADSTTEVIRAGHVYSSVAVAVVRSSFTFLKRDVLRTFAIYLFMPLGLFIGGLELFTAPDDTRFFGLASGLFLDVSSFFCSSIACFNKVSI